MTPEEFVRALHTVVVRTGSDGFIEALRHPPGRTPPQWLADLAAWYAALDDKGRRHAEMLIRESAASALYFTLAVLDGTMSIEGLGEKGALVLDYVRGGDRTRLNPQQVSLQETSKSLHGPERI